MRNARRSRSKVGAGLVAAVTIAALSAGPATAAPTAKRRARVAVGYIVDNQQNDGLVNALSEIGSTADAVLAMVAARRAPKAIEKAIGYLEQNIDDVDDPTKSCADWGCVGEKGKIAMAAAAAGENPFNFAGKNLVVEILADQRPSGRLGAGTPVYDHALGMLGLGAAGIQSRKTAEWLANAQCRDGGWQWDGPPKKDENRHCYSGAGDWFTSDSNTTGLAVQALALTEVKEELKESPFKYFRSARDLVKKGWRYSHKEFFFGTPVYTDTDSTSAVLQAFAAAGRTPPKGSRRALARLQYRLCGNTAGAFARTWAEDDEGKLRKDARNLASTIAAVPALLRLPFPIDYADVTKAAPQPGPC